VPLDEYRCQTCGIRFEALRPMCAAREDAPCPADAGTGVRVLSPFASTMVGGGDELRHTAHGEGGCACSSGGVCGCRRG